MNYQIFDMERGNFLKLGENKEVLAGYRGLTRLTDEQIKEAYGSPVPKFDLINWPKLASVPSEDGPNFSTH
jgi:hypothetical protein